MKWAMINFGGTKPLESLLWICIWNAYILSYAKNLSKETSPYQVHLNVTWLYKKDLQMWVVASLPYIDVKCLWTESVFGPSMI